jgi:hypothetical protein
MFPSWSMGLAKLARFRVWSPTNWTISQPMGGNRGGIPKLGTATILLIQFNRDSLGRQPRAEVAGVESASPDAASGTI